MMGPCGVDCEKCGSYQDTRAGCRAVDGKVYWAGYVGAEICPMYSCSVNDKKLNHCGECGELPCHYYYETKDPSTTAEEHEAGIRLRVDILRGLQR